MKIALLSINPENYSSERLVEAGKERGHEVEVINYLRCTMTITSSHNPTVSYQGRKLNDFDAVIPRIGSSNTFYGCAVVRQFEMMGAYAINPSLAISRSRDKLRCLQILAQKGIGLPVTSYAHDIEDVQEVIDAVGGAPLVVKLLEGTQGIGVVLCETKPAATSVIEAFRGLDANILAQEFISEAEGSDIRAFVVGDKVVAAMKRMSAKGEFRSNLHRGGTSEKVKLTPEERSTAVRAAKAMNLKVAGVDLLRSKHGPLVIEINSSPGLEGIEKTSEKPVGSMIIEYIEGAVETHKKDRVQA